MSVQRRILGLLSTHLDGMTSDQMAELLGADLYTVRKKASALKRSCVIHIGDWSEPDAKGNRSAIYRIGAHRDAPRPTSEANRRKDARRKARRQEAERQARLKAQQEAQQAAGQEIARHAIEIAMYGGPASVTVRIPPVPVDAWEAA